MIKLTLLPSVLFSLLQEGQAVELGLWLTCCSFINLGMDYVDSVKILLVLQSYLIQNSWTQIVDVLVLKVL